MGNSKNNLEYTVLSYNAKERDKYRLIPIRNSIFDAHTSFTLLIYAHPYERNQQFSKPDNAFGIFYKINQDNQDKSNHTNKPKRGFVEGFAARTDYHPLVKSALHLILNDFVNKNKLHPHVSENAKLFVDISPYSDKEIGFYGGLGKFGKNHLLISTKYGTRFFIGYVLIEQEFPNLHNAPSLKEEDIIFPKCKECNLCVRACPSKVCGIMNADMSKCLSGVTQSKGEIEEKYFKLIEDRIYGCGICQDICPSNVKYEVSDDGYIDLREIITMSSKQFKTKYSNCGFSWLPHWVFVRNAIIIMGNIGDMDDVKFLCSLNGEKYDKIRQYIKYSISRIIKRFP